MPSGHRPSQPSPEPDAFSETDFAEWFDWEQWQNLAEWQDIADAVRTDEEGPGDYDGSTEDPHWFGELSRRLRRRGLAVDQ